mgnify:CR=1 FL=1
MAERRMFAKTIVDSDAFLDMPQTAQLLYFHLAMRADDDGFINKPKTVMRMVGSRDDDLACLAAKKFIIPFESGVVVIKHWKIHNYIRGDRYVETKYKNEKDLLETDENKAYRLPVSEVDTIGLPSDNQMDTQVRLGKVRLGKDSNIYCPVVAFLNEKTGAKYRASSQSTRRLIDARVNDGFTLEDFKTVISKKCAEWKGTDMEKYLRPETLFGTKFEGYLNAKSKGQSCEPDPDMEKYDLMYEEKP